MRFRRLTAPIVLFVIAAGVLGACSDDSQSPLVSTAVEPGRDSQGRPYLRPGVPVPEGAIPAGAPEPYNARRHGPPTPNTMPEANLAAELNAHPVVGASMRGRRDQSRERGRARPSRSIGVSASSDPPPPGNGDRGFYVKKGVGIYAGNDAERGITIPTSTFGPVTHTPATDDSAAVVYAPTHLPDVEGGTTVGCIEATTVHWAWDHDTSTEDLHGFWDWCGDEEFEVLEDMDSSTWRSKYVRTYDGEERFYISVVPEDPADAEGNCWQGLIWNFNTGSWEEKLESCGTGPSWTQGWTMWEQWYHQTCPAYPHIRSADIQIQKTDSTWVDLETSHTNTLGYGPCWSDSTWAFDTHTTSPEVSEWFGHTTAVSVTINGTTSISSAGSYTWTSSVSGSHPSYTYQWEYCPLNGSCSNVGTSSSYTRTVSMSDFSFELKLTATSNGYAQKQDTHLVCIDGQPC